MLSVHDTNVWSSSLLVPNDAMLRKLWSWLSGVDGKVWFFVLGWFWVFVFLGEQSRASLRCLEFVELLGDSSEDRLAGTLICWGSRISVWCLEWKIWPNGCLTIVQASCVRGRDALVQWSLWQKGCELFNVTGTFPKEIFYFFWGGNFHDLCI